MVEEYNQLLDTYRRMFGLMDAFHFNSQNTADVYGRYLDIPMDSRVISITHGGIADHRKQRGYSSDLLRLGFIGSSAPYKGLPMLRDVLDQLNHEGFADKVVLHVYGGRTGQDVVLENVFYKGRFTNDMMEQVYDDMDLLVVPSICYETFSFVTLEALSYGTAVLVSNNVGAKDIVNKYAPEFVYRESNDLYRIIKELLSDRHKLIDYNYNIIQGDWDYSIEKHAKIIVEELYV